MKTKKHTAAPTKPAVPDPFPHYQSVEKAFWRIDSAMDAMHSLVTSRDGDAGQLASGLSWASKAMMTEMVSLLVAVELLVATSPASSPLLRPQS